MSRINRAAPILDVAWGDDGKHIFAAGADKQGIMWNLSTNTQTPIAAHEAPIRCFRWCGHNDNGASCVVTCSWDRTLRYWDIRRANERSIGAIHLSDKVYAMDARLLILVAGAADR